MITHARKRNPRPPGKAVPTTAREVAAVVLHRVCTKDAYAMRALDAELGRARLSERDNALATEIVYGTLRVLSALDHRLACHLRRGVAETDGLTLAVLRSSTYQLDHLARLPVHAIVDEAVGFIRRSRSAASAGFVNAVLRRLAANRPAAPAPADRVLMPPWLVERLTESLGPERAAAFVAPCAFPPPLCLAVRPGERDALVQALRHELPEADVQAAGLSPMGVLLRRAGDPRRLGPYRAGRCWVQEEGAQLVALAVAPGRGDLIADVCAGHGGKTLALTVLQDGQGPITAIDVDEAKLSHLEREFSRLHLRAAGLVCRAMDLTQAPGEVAARYDRVLVDAPCSGVGTLLRRPELLLRLSPADLPRLTELQVCIARHGLGLVREGGHFFFAVCSPLGAEGRDVAERLEQEVPGLLRLDSSIPALDLPADSDGILRVGPWNARASSFPDAYQVLHYQVRRAPARTAQLWPDK